MTEDELRQVAEHYRNGTWWWACEHPERPTTVATRWHNPGQCDACTLKARAAQAQLDATGDVLGGLACDDYLRHA